MTEQRLHQLEQAVAHLLEGRPQGWAEYEMITALRERDIPLLPSCPLDDHLGLFQVHFLLFHVLYRLRDRFRAEGRGELRIGVLEIALGPHEPGEEGLSRADPLREYYLNLEELRQTTADDVEALLESFWGRVGIGDGRCEEALAVLELEPPVDYGAIRRRYRSLVMRHHPDRGGDTARIQALNEAMAVLERCYGTA